jgi:hypothetical protein
LYQRFAETRCLRRLVNTLLQNHSAFHNGTNIIAKQDAIFLGEEILEFFMAPTVKTHLSVLAQKIPTL